MKETVNALKAILLIMPFVFGVSFALAQQKSPTPIKEVFEPTGSFPKASWAKVAVVQWNPTSPAPLGVTKAQAEAFKSRNREALEEYIREAASQGAEMVITPEFAVVGYPDIPDLPDEEDNFRNKEDVAPYGEAVPGPTSRFFSALAKELGIYIHAGFVEYESARDNYYNTVVAVDPAGKVVAKYRKMHPFKLEENYITKGTQPVIYNSPYGKIGLIICSDVYSDPPMSFYADQKVNVLALSTSWAQWDTGMRHFQAGAKQVGAYLLAANQTYFPDSGVVTPTGGKQSHIRQSSGLAYGYIPRVK
jgi:deaminated glutathione amidase